MSEETIKQYLYGYENADATFKDIMKAKKMYRGLKCSQDLYTFTNGTKKNLINLIGTIPVPFKGKIYNIPVRIWLMDTHPKHAPLCFVVPTPDMCLKPSMQVDLGGKIYLPYLHEWSANNSNLLDLIQTMINKFSESPPVFNKPKQTVEVSSKAAPYPTQAYTSTATNSVVTSPFPGTGGSPFSMFPPTQRNSCNFQYAVYPPYPTQNNVYPPTLSTSTQSGNFPVYPPTSNISPPYPPVQTSNLPYPTHPSAQPNLTSSSSSPPNNTGTITNEHIQASLMSAVEDKIRRKINEQTALCRDEIEILLQTQLELNQGKNKLDVMFENLEKEKQNVTQKIQILKEKEIELEKAVEKLSVEEDIDVDDAVVTTTPLYKQILNAHCEDAATEDTIYYIGEALRRGIIDLDVFIKQLRSLSRKRLMLRSLLEKCRVKAGLTV